MAAPTDAVDLNPFAVAVVVAGTVLGPKLAAVVAAYGLIAMGWGCGVLYGLYRRAPDARMPVWAYMLCSLMVSVGLTVIVADWLAGYIGSASTALLFPVAAMIPAFPDKWEEWGRAIFTAWRAARAGGKP